MTTYGGWTLRQSISQVNAERKKFREKIWSRERPSHKGSTGLVLISLQSDTDDLYASLPKAEGDPVPTKSNALRFPQSHGRKEHAPEPQQRRSPRFHPSCMLAAAVHGIHRK